MIIAPGQVHVWHVDLDALDPEAFRYSLSVEETGRAERFYKPRDRDRFISARGVLRSILARYIPGEPAAFLFAYNAQGKPSLAGKSDLRFNLSHSHRLALYALTMGREIGADLERIREGADPMKIAGRFFSPQEVEELQALPVEKRNRACFRCWTRKEAYIKAKGQGLTIPLRSFSVSTVDGGPTTCGEGWYLWDADPAIGYAGAIAIQSADCHLVMQEFG